LTVVVAIMVVLDAAMIPAMLSWALVDPYAFSMFVRDQARLNLILYGVVAVTMILFSIWIYTAGRNLENADLDLEYTAGSRIWWFAVPFANLIKPFQAMRELWNASHGEEHYDENSAVVTLWWAAWLGAGFASYFLTSLATSGGGTGPLWVESGLLAVRAALAIAVIRGIAVAQGRTLTGDQLQEVFA
jgi:hypothetical protein